MMAFEDFTFRDLREQFGIRNEIVDLFEDETIVTIPPSDFLRTQLANARELPLKSEKARSEFFVAPVLMELRHLTNKFFTIYSGENLVADPEKGLSGECDFILARSNRTYDITTPICAIVEAKRENLELGIQQCAAQLYGAQILNRKSGLELETLYGCVTTADNWQFISLTDKMVRIDESVYFRNELDKILGIFQHIFRYYRERLTE